MAGTSTRSAILADPAAQIRFTVASDGAVFAAIGDGILGTDGDAWTLGNFATIATTDSSGAAVDRTAGGLLSDGGTGNFNDDGQSDILWQDASGDVASREMNGLNVVDNGFVDNGFLGFADPTTWDSAGGFSGDGMTIVPWQDASGDVAVQEMNGAGIAASSLLGYADPASWQTVPPDNTGDPIPPAAATASAASPNAVSAVSAVSAPPPATPTAPASVTIGAPGGLQIVLRWDPSVANAPAGFMAAVEAAAQFYVDTFNDPVTLTLNVGWGEITQNGVSQPITSPGEALGGPNAGDTFTYDQVLAALRANATSAADLTAIASLAAEPGFSGTIYVSSAEEKALGLIINTPGGSSDGSVGFSAPPSTFTYDFNPNDRSVAGEADFVGLAEHEIGHALGRFSPLAEAGFAYYSVLDLFRFSAPGARQLTGGQPAYFSIDGGATDLNNFNTTSDLADWSGSNGIDSYNAIYTVGSENPVSPTDITEMNVLGYTLTADAGELPVLWIDDSSGAIGMVNPANGTVTVIGNSGQSLTDIAFNTAGQLYGVTASALYSINQRTGAATLIGSLNAGNNGIDALAWVDGTLYAASSATTQLYAVNTATGQATALTGTLPAAAAGDLVFESGQLYMNDVNGNLDQLTIAGTQVSGAVAFSFSQSGISGLAAGLNGTLYGVLGSQLQIIDPSTGTLTPALSYSGQGLGTALGMTEMIGQPAPRDFNGDGLSDILWQNDNGSVAIWEMNGTGILNLASDFVIGLDSTWHIAGTGDFNGDGKSDMLWQNDNGSVAIWEMNGTSILNLNSDFVTSLDPSWHIRGTGDFNGDGKSDMLWQNDNGSVAIWEMNGTSILNLASDFVISLDASWHIRGTGDFNGDGTSDILWQNDNGSVAIWEMNGTSILNLASDSLISVDPSWHIRGTGDFNGDGNSDILWQNDNGAVAIWEMNGTNILNLASDFVISLDPTWHIRGTGDYNGDGKSDILWQNDNGSVAIWEMNGTSILNLASDSLIAVDPSWHIIPPDNTGDIAPETSASAGASAASFGFADISGPAASAAPPGDALPQATDGGGALLPAVAPPAPAPAHSVFPV